MRRRGALFNAWLEIRFARPDIYPRRADLGYGAIPRRLFTASTYFMDGQPGRFSGVR
jgi:hypothetical protein